MKIKLFLSAFFVMLAVSFAYASFPVQRTAVAASESITTTDSEVSETAELTTPLAMASQQSKGIAILLWFFLK